VSGAAYRDRSGRPIRLGEPLGAGGEGSVFAVLGGARLCAKVYHPHRAAERAEKLEAMIASPPSWTVRRALAWPASLLFDDDRAGAFAGFLMPKQPRMLELYRLLVPDERLQIAAYLTAKDLRRLAAAVAGIVDGIHREGHCIGDLKPANILVEPLSRRLLWIDTDSFQIRDRATGRVHRSAVVTPEYTAPELFGDPLHTRRTPASDAFALAVFIHQILLGGAHPFEGELASGRASLERIPGRIRHGQCPLLAGVSTVRLAESALSATTLHPELRELFVRCFGSGHERPDARPKPSEWREALLAASRAMVRCRASSAHVHDATLARCPWCERRDLTGLDLFPEKQRWQHALARWPTPARAPRAQRRRWLSRHVRTRARGGTLTQAERTFVLKAGAALGLDREFVTSTLEASLLPRLDARRHAAALLAQLTVLRSRLPRLRQAPRRAHLVAVCVAALAGALVIAATDVKRRLETPADDGPEPASRECFRTTALVAAKHAVIGNTRGQGAYLRASPSTASAKLPLPEGTTVRLTGQTRAGTALAWTEVEVEHLKRVGWVATRYVIEPR
jgi:hypothetical protein